MSEIFADPPRTIRIINFQFGIGDFIGLLFKIWNNMSLGFSWTYPMVLSPLWSFFSTISRLGFMIGSKNQEDKKEFIYLMGLTLLVYPVLFYFAFLNYPNGDENPAWASDLTVKV
jgi:hypothetical protein